MDNPAPSSPNMDPAAKAILSYVNEAKLARIRRIDLNRQNFDCYHLNTDWTHKRKGQSTEFLGKQQMAVEQIVSFLQQGLVDTEEWFDIEYNPGVDTQADPVVLKAGDWKSLLNRQLDRIDPSVFIADALKLGLLGSLMICKVHGQMSKKSKFEIEALQGDNVGRVKLFRNDKYAWELVLDLVRQEDWYPDDTGDGLYEIQAIDIDYHRLLEVAKSVNEKEPGTYDIQAIEQLQGHMDMEQEGRKARETNQSNTMHATRKRVRLYELWGTILDPGTHLPIMEHGTCTIADNGTVICPPRDNPFWHGESPFVVSPIIRVPHSVWHRALMDAPTMHNRALNELYNLMVDGGMMSVFGIKQLRENWLSDPNQVSDGIMAGETLLLNASAPPMGKVLERVDTGAVAPETMNMYNLVDREFQSASLSNSTTQGNLPQRAVKATEIVAANQSITGIFNGIVKIIETTFLERVLTKALLTMAQFMDDLDEADVSNILGAKAPLAKALQPEKRFQQIANGVRFKVFGLSTLLSRMNDFRKITSLLQTISGSPLLMSQFQAKYSFTSLLGEIMKALDIDTEKLELTDQEKQQMQQQQQAAAAAAGAAQAQQGGGQGAPGGPPSGMTPGQQPGTGPNAQSQIPQVANMAANSSMPHALLQQNVHGPGT
jgi:hypothetical protein